MANSAMQNFNYQIGKICRLVSRKVKLMAISNRRNRQLRHLGERVYIFKALQQENDIWEKDEISQLLLTIADLEQEQEMIIDEINEIKAETPPSEQSVCESTSTDKAPVSDVAPEPANKAPAESQPAKTEPSKTAEKTDDKADTTEKVDPPKAKPRRKTASKKSEAKSETKNS